MNEIIKTERLILRQWKLTDCDELIKMNQDAKVMKYFLSIMSGKQSLEFYERVQQHFKEHGFGLYVVEDKTNHQFMGYTGFMIANFESSFTPCVEIGWRFNAQYWGKGFATEAANACLQYGYDTLGLKTIYSFTSVHNKKSEAVMQRIGMHKTGEFNHPKIEFTHFLCPHVIYKKELVS